MAMVKMFGGVLALALVAQPAMAASLSAKQKARVARAPAGEREDVRYCLLKSKSGKDKGTVIGAVGAGGVAAVAGADLGGTALAAGVGALVGNRVGKGTAGGSECDRVLKRNP